MIKVGNRNWVGQAPRQCLACSRGWTWQTYKQESVELDISEGPQKYFTTNIKPQKILSKKQNPNKYPQKHCSFRETQASCDNNGIMETHDY